LQFLGILLLLLEIVYDLIDVAENLVVVLVVLGDLVLDLAQVRLGDGHLALSDGFLVDVLSYGEGLLAWRAPRGSLTKTCS